MHVPGHCDGSLAALVRGSYQYEICKLFYYIGYWIDVVVAGGNLPPSKASGFNFFVLSCSFDLLSSLSTAICWHFVECDATVSTPGRGYMIMVPILKRIVILAPDPDPPYQSAKGFFHPVLIATSLVSTLRNFWFPTIRRGTDNFRFSKLIPANSSYSRRLRAAGGSWLLWPSGSQFICGIVWLASSSWKRRKPAPNVRC